MGRRLTSHLLTLLAAAALLAPAATAAGVQDRVRAFSLAALTHTGTKTKESPWTHPGSVEIRARIAAGSSVAAKGAEILPKPIVDNPKLGNIVNDLYKGTTNPNRVGTGTTSDAIRNEIATGQATAGRFHAQKGFEYERALGNFMRRNPGASYRDRLTAQSLLDDLRSARGGP